LHFILQRERGIIGGGLSLWSVEGTREQPYYRHSIHTDFRTSAYPNETRGGILADEMGLGKTLSMISAIVTSLDEAITYPEEQNDLKRHSALHRSRATLIIAPSAGLCLPVAIQRSILLNLLCQFYLTDGWEKCKGTNF
jgi:SWI/SNF-related matrix-associated actin-dependent regulator of chromatin subfamily A3